MNHALLLRLKDARYKILVACRPLEPAKYAFNATLKAIIDTVDMDEETSRAVESLMLLD